ncbi:MAG: hypothetical protein HZB26_07910 [Candidatus Hydrogenedentes bacterium]|nr:hypothetical protein [Candidatus Hydrogenedentota bacterium]
MPKSKLTSGIAAALLLAVACAANAYGDSFNQRVRKANRQLINGDPGGALSMYRDLQTDDPESHLLYYGQGCAQYKQGEQEIESPSPEHAIENFKAARDSFAKASLSPDERIRRQAIYNGANTGTRLAELSAKAGDGKAATDAFKSAIGQYEELLKRNPNDTAARNNLDHARYLLKKLLQNPPKPQEQKQDGQGKQDQKKEDPGKEQESEQKQQGQSAEGDKKDQQGEQGQSQEQKQAQAQQQDGKDKEDSEKNSDQNNKDGDKSTEAEKKQQLAEAKKNDNQQQSQDQNSAQQNEKQKPDQQSIEAILDSLEAQDNREQKDMQNPRGSIRMRRDWW